jgi:hypothetical protein
LGNPRLICSQARSQVVFAGSSQEGFQSMALNPCCSPIRLLVLVIALNLLLALVYQILAECQEAAASGLSSTRRIVWISSCGLTGLVR